MDETRWKRSCPIRDGARGQTSPERRWASTRTDFRALPGVSFVKAGAYMPIGLPGLHWQTSGTLAGVYRTPAMYVESTAVFSHTSSAGPYRGHRTAGSRYVNRAHGSIARRRN